MTTVAWAEYVEQDGLRFSLHDSDIKYAEVEAPESGSYSGEITIPSVVSDGGEDYTDYNDGGEDYNDYNDGSEDYTDYNDGGEDYNDYNDGGEDYNDYNDGGEDYNDYNDGYDNY